MVLVLNKFIAFLAGMGLYSLFKALLPEAGFAKLYTGIDIYSVFRAVLWAIPVWWILRHVDKLPDGFGRYLWTEILRLLPEELKWEEIESTDFGETLRVIYENGMCSNVSLDRLPSFIVMSAVLSVLEERLNQVGLFAYLYASPENQVLCDFAEKLLADIYRLGYVKKNIIKSISFVWRLYGRHFFATRKSKKEQLTKSIPCHNKVISECSFNIKTKSYSLISTVAIV